MQVSTFSIKLAVSLLITLSLIGCRKKIDYSTSSDIWTEVIDPNQPVYGPWDSVDVGNIYDISHVESDGHSIYFTGTSNQLRQVFKMDSLGTITSLITINSSILQLGSVTLLQYEPQSQLFYYCLEGVSSGAIRTFDSTGPLHSYDFDLGGIVNFKINALIDLDTSLVVGGRYSVSGTGNPSSKNITILNKTTGVSYPLDGISREVMDLEFYNNEIYCSGHALTGVFAWGGWAVMKYNGLNWISVGYTNNTGYNNTEPPKVTGIKAYDNKLYAAGNLNSAMAEIINNNYSNNQNIWNMADPKTYIYAKFEEYNGVLYAYGDIAPSYNTFKCVLRKTTGSWQKVGAIDEKAEDIAVLGNTVYAVVNGGLLKHGL